MAKNLVIVESPAKAKTINKYLGSDYKVLASIGHIKDLPTKELGVDIENNFEPLYEVIPDVKKRNNKKTVSDLKKAAKEADTIYLAADPDREGEAICQHLAEEIVPKKPKKEVFRVMFNEITKKAIQEAFKIPKQVNQDLVDAQQARRVLDRLVGYKVSPILWKTIGGKLSAGRVQTVAVRLVVEREREIEAFVQTEYWTIIANLSAALPPKFDARLYKIEDLTVKTSGFDQDVKKNETHIKDEATAKSIVEEAEKQNYVVDSVTTKERKRNATPPFITSKLQQEAARKHGFPVKKAMMVAQKLYEGVEIGAEGAVGLITYMRTDSTRLNDEAVSAVRGFIYDSYGPEYLPKEPHHFKKRKESQDAHEAIRPTTIKFAPKHIKKHLDKDIYALYELIWNRFVACQMVAAAFEQVTVDLSGGDYTFRATGSVPIFRGFLQVYDDMIDEKGLAEDDDPTSKIPSNLNVGQHASLRSVLPKQHFTKPAARYTESSLIKELESLGIGRPSTYAAIVSTIIDRKYVDQQERKLFATQLGMVVTKILVHSFPKVLNVKFTALMEEELDTIASGKNNYVQVMDDFYHPFIDSLHHVEKDAGRIKKSLQEETGEACDLCGKPMIIKWGRYGQFKACTGYPACKNRKPLDADVEKHQHTVGLKCKQCGGDLVVKGGPFGTFLGCSNYPKCNYTQPISMGLKCPKCKEGDVIERKTKRKRYFYGCSRYPECDFVSWDKPVIQECENCKNPYLVQKSSKKKGEYLMCPNCKEEFVREETAIAV